MLNVIPAKAGIQSSNPMSISDEFSIPQLLFLQYRIWKIFHLDGFLTGFCKIKIQFWAMSKSNSPRRITFYFLTFCLFKIWIVTLLSHFVPRSNAPALERSQLACHSRESGNPIIQSLTNFHSSVVVFTISRLKNFPSWQVFDGFCFHTTLTGFICCNYIHNLMQFARE